MSDRKRKNSGELELNDRHEPVNTEAENENLKKKATRVLHSEFDKELKVREKEIEHIDERLSEALRIQHLLRYAVVSSYYGVRTSQGDWPENMSSKHSLHPAVAGLLRKTRPDKDRNKGCFNESCTLDSDGQLVVKKMAEEGANLLTKVPRYIPPVSKKDFKIETSPTRGSHTKIRQRIIVGNVSRWIPVESREDGASHKWMVYVRGPENVPDLSHLVEKVRFFLHASYRPFDVVEIKTSPYRLSRRGWGEFPIRVQVHFRNPLNKPIDIIHILTLDQTRSIKEALGAETIVEVWLHTDEDQRDSAISQTYSSEENDVPLDEKPQVHLVEIKTEIKEEPCDSNCDEETQMSDCSTEIFKIREAIEQEVEPIKQEVVIEDGFFPMDSNYVMEVTNEPILSVHNYSSNHRVADGSSNVDSRYPEDGVRSVLHPDAGVSRAPFSSSNCKIVGGYGPSTSSSSLKQGVTKGTSLLIKNSNLPPGTSLLLRNPATSIASVLATNKPPVDGKLSMYMSSMNNLSKRLHKELGAATRHILNSLPIITPKASDPVYKTLHSYSVDSEATFLSWPVAKQRASEWMRANMVRKYLTDQGFSEDGNEAWTTKVIMEWARLWGYTPVAPRMSLSNCQHDGDEVLPRISCPTSTYSEPKKVYEWLSSLENEIIGSRDEDDGEEIDVENIGPAPKRCMLNGSRGMGLGARAAVSQKVIVLGMESSLNMVSRFVDEASREIGIVVSCPEEMIPCVFYTAAQRMLIEALKSFMKDLIRSSLCFAFRRTPVSPDIPLIINTEDVELAILNRPEFDLLTNEGLSAKTDDTSKWDP